MNVTCEEHSAFSENEMRKAPVSADEMDLQRDRRGPRVQQKCIQEHPDQTPTSPRVSVL